MVVIFIYVVERDYLMKNLSMKLPDDIVQQLDILVERGIYQSRNEALRSLISKGVKKEFATMFLHDQTQQDRINSIVNQFKEMNIVLDLESEKTAVQLVSEERER